MRDHDPTDTTGATPFDGPTSKMPPDTTADDGSTSNRPTISAADATRSHDQGRHSTKPDSDPEKNTEATVADRRAGAIDDVPAGLDEALARTFLPADPSPDAASPTVPGYDRISPLGEGGMGVVWKARQVKLNRLVALKMVLGDQRAGSKELIRFLAEAEAVAAVKHPHVVQVYEYGDANGRPFLAMEYLPGGSLTERLRQTGRLDPKAAAALVGTLASAIQAAHDLGIVHRDMKPGNVLYDEHGRPKVTDFGLAKRSGGGDLTATQAVMGTPAYMAPEQARGDTKFVGPQADVYSLGVILYECLTGTHPFADPDRFALLRKVVEEGPERPGKRVPGVPHDVELICLKCLEKAPSERYPTAGALAADLARFAAGEPISVRASGLVERVAKWARRKPTLAAAYTLGLLAVLLGGLGGAAVWQWQAAERARDLAEIARGQADRARIDETEARSEAVRQREKFERFEYGRTIQVAHQEWRENNVAATLALLDSTRADLHGWEWRYVHRLCHSDLISLTGHTGSVNAASFSPDGTRVVTCCADGTAKVWDATSGGEIFAIPKPTDPGQTISNSDEVRIDPIPVPRPGETLGLTPFSSDEVRIDATNGRRTIVHRALNGPRITSWTSGGSDRARVGIWDARKGSRVVTLKGQAGGVASPSLSPDGALIVAGAQQNTAAVWDANSGAEILTLRGHNGPVYLAAFSTDGARIVTASDDKTARVWDAKSGAQLPALKGHIGRAIWLSFSPDGSRVVVVCDDNTARLWDARSGAEVLTLKGHTDRINSLRFSPDGSRVVTASDDKTARVWDVKGGAEVFTFEEHNGRVRSASFSPDGMRVVSGGFDWVRVWDARNGAELLNLKDESGHAIRLSFSPDGSRIAGVLDIKARVWDARSGGELLSFQTHNGPPGSNSHQSASFSPDGSHIVVGCRDGAARVWDARSGAELLTLKGHSGWVDSASFSPDGSRVVTAGKDGTARVWDAQSGAEVLTLKGHTDRIFSASFSPDGSRIITASEDKTARVWDARSGAELLAFQGHTQVVFTASYSPDGTRVVTASADKTARVWDAQSGAEVLTLKGHTDRIFSASFSPDGSRIITGSSDGTAKVWDARPVNREFLTGRPAPPQRAVK